VAQSATFYRDVLGFTLVHHDTGFAIVRWDEEVDELHAELQPRGILHPNAQLHDQPWGTREFGVSDPDNNLITFFERR
jgi:catechol 2,3-dioxygenase-like lactoylglutathione lyase family enzyme